MEFDLKAYVEQIVDKRLEERLAALKARDDEWLDIPAAVELTKLSEWHVREFVKKLQAEGSPDIYQPNGPRSKPLRVRRSALRNLKAA